LIFSQRSSAEHSIRNSSRTCKRSVVSSTTRCVRSS